MALALATLGQAGYIWYLQTAGAVTAPGRIRVDGPEGAEVRIDGRSIGIAPVEHNLDAGDYDVELLDKGRVVRADRVSVGVGSHRGPARASARRSTGGQRRHDRRRRAAPQAASGCRARTSPDRQPTRTWCRTPPGAVTIESTPPGLPVTMGGRPRGVTPLTLGRIPPGRHDVLVGRAALQVDVTAGEVATLRVPR